MVINNFFYDIFFFFVILLLLIFFKFFYFVINNKILAAYEKFFLIFLLLFKSTSRKKYLQEKYRTIKEKAARAKTWARKHEGSLNTFKGFYIPTTLPHSEQGKFFQKKRSEDEEWLRDFYLKKEKIEKKKINFRKFYTTEKTFKQRKKDLLLGFYKTNKNYLSDLNKGYSFWTAWLNNRFIWKWDIASYFFLRFSKKFINSVFLPILVWDYQHLWSYLNMGQNTNWFLNFFFIQYFPMFLINFNFLKNKVLLLKQYWSFFISSNGLESFCISRNLLINFLNIFLWKKYFNCLPCSFINNYYFFSKVFNNWQKVYFSKFFFKEFMLDFLLKHSVNTLTGQILYGFLLIIFKNFSFSIKKKQFLKQIFLTRLCGSQNFNILKKRARRKPSYQLYFFTEEKSFHAKWESMQFVSLLFLNKNIDKSFYLNSTLLTFPYMQYLIDVIFSGFEFFAFTWTLLTRPLFLFYLETFNTNSNSLNKVVFPTGWRLSKNFFLFLKKWIWTYEMTWFLIYSSFRQQINLVEKFNVADILFWYIIWKGKKLTAWSVFLKFLKKFRKKYNLPGLAVFGHAMLFVEPKIWIKEKKMAGWVYNIPIYISSSWSRRIAIRWLLQAAKKRKWASITDSLAQEVWDACFGWGAAFNNKESVQLTVKRNKAYLRWL